MAGIDAIAHSTGIKRWRERAEATREFLREMGTTGMLIGGRVRRKYPNFGKTSGGYEHDSEGIDMVLTELEKVSPTQAIKLRQRIGYAEPVSIKRESLETLPWRQPKVVEAAQEVLSDITAQSPLQPEVYHNEPKVPTEKEIIALAKILKLLDEVFEPPVTSVTPPKSSETLAVGISFTRTSTNAITTKTRNDKGALVVGIGYTEPERITYTVRLIQDGWVSAYSADGKLLTFHRDQWKAVRK